MPSARRLTTLTGAMVAGVAATAMFAAPASAHEAIVTGSAECAVDGTYTIHWKIENKRFSDDKGWDLTLTHVQPAGIKLDGQEDLEGYTIKANDNLEFEATGIPGTTKETVELSFEAQWSDEWPDPSSPYSASIELKGDCKATASPSPSASQSHGTGGGGTTPSASASVSPSKSATPAPALPVTGSSTGLYAGGAVVLLGAGAGLFVLARRRRIKFEA